MQTGNGRGAPAPSRLLISHITLRGPELQQTYAHIVAHDEVGYEDLSEKLAPVGGIGDHFGLDDAIMREALDFLLVARLIEQHGASRRRATFHAVPLLPDVPFSLLLLHHIASLLDEPQRALALVHRQLTAEDVLSVTPASLRDRMERGRYAKLFTWTSEKVTFWSQLAAYLGLVRKLEREGRFLLVPQASLVLAAVQYEARRCSSPASTFPVASALDGVEARFFACYTQERRVHRGLAQTLLALHHLGHICLTHESDAPRSLLLGNRRVSHISLARPEERAR